MDFKLTEHARESLLKRPSIRMTWVEQVLRNTERSEPDGIDPDLEHRLGRIDECEGRVSSRLRQTRGISGIGL